jgi:predicted MPP superfamily phosphohydrolase
MSWPLHGPVDERDDYRDRAFIERVARSAARGVVLSGVSRSGKTSLLHRLKESLPDSFCPMVSLERGPKATLHKLREDLGRGVLLDEGQLLLSWPVQAQRQLIAALADRPFVLAAWPTIFDPEASREIQRWLEGLRFERLLPFSREEARAMIRRARSETPKPCDDAIIEAVFEATGGYAVLVARLCDFLSDNGRSPLRRPDDEQLSWFVDSVRRWNDPFQAMLGSLPRAHQDAVRDLSRGDRGALAWLIDHGLACENPPRYSGKLFAIAWRAGETATRPLPAEIHRASSRIIPVLRWIHLSDIHFGAGDPSRGFDRQAVTRAICEDTRALAGRWGSPDRVLVTGDIAQRADPREYEAAHGWLRDLSEAASASLDRVRVVPGNHDVDRSIAAQTPVQRAHEAIRESPEEIDGDLVQDPELRSNLAKKLGAYRSFVASKLPGHPAACPTGIDWSELLPAVPGGRGRVRLAGLSTVWVSDAFDGRDKRHPDARPLCPNLVVGRGQLELTIGAPDPMTLLLVLTHHPPEWLDPRSAGWLQGALAPHAHVHLSGHVHDAQAGVLRRLGRSGTSVRYVAGASHGDPTETYGYAWGGVRWNGAEGRWEVGWAPRIYVPEMQRVVADRTRYPELSSEGFAWERIELGWLAPTAE